MNPPGRLERVQVLVYLAAIAAGLTLGLALPMLGPFFDSLLLPAIALLLLVTFTQVPLTEVPRALRDVRFLLIVLTGNFVIIPVVVVALLLLVPLTPSGIDAELVRLGIVLVLVVPCTDWFLTFTHLARGDVPRAIALTPVLLLVQLLLLPVYLLIFTGERVEQTLEGGDLAVTFAVLIVMPLALAAIVQAVARRGGESSVAASVIRGSARLPVWLLAFVLLLVAGSQVAIVLDALVLIPLLAGVFTLYLLSAVALGFLTARLARLPAPAARTLVFSLATRNSFVVLPIALAVPNGGGIVAVVVVTQSLIELLGMVVLVRVARLR